MTTPGGGIELAQIWVPLMPEASKLAAGVERIGRDAEKRFGAATKVMGSQMARAVESNAGRLRQALADVEKRTLAVEKAKQREADTQGRLNVAEKRYHELRNSSSAKESQRIKAYEDMNRLQRALTASTTTLTRETKMLATAQAEVTAAQAAQSKVAKLPIAQRLAVAAQASGVDAGRSFHNGFNSMLRSGAMLAGVGGFAATLKGVVTAGVDMEANLNRLQGVTNANAQQMARASEVAQKLGSDTTIVGATAASAAAAMLELAKGGLTMEQALAAAPGTLRLAAAASIDAATAAESQAAILNSFQLAPDQANHVADALANVANAAAGEVPDFMMALQQAATVAHGFNISMDDTVAVMGLFAKAGIQGSDAGTSFKTMLTHIANPSDEAAGAMDRLGLNLHTATGEFVGVREMFRQIGEAGKVMRPDDFQRDVAKVFGTDAIRGAMIAGNQGIETLDQMMRSVTEVGGATKMAAANMQGVPGVLEKISNAASGVGLTFYDMLKPLLMSGGKGAIDLLERAQKSLDSIKRGEGGGKALGMIADGWKDISGAVKDIGPELLEAVKSLATGAAATVVTGWRALGTAFQVIEPPLRMVLDLLNAIPGGLETTAALIAALYLKTKLAGPAMSVAAKATEGWAKAFSGWRSAADTADRTMTRITTATGETVLKQRGFMTQIRDAYRQGATESERFGRSIGTAKGAMSGLKIAGGGIMSMLGGPWGIAATGLIAAMGAVANAHANAAEAARNQKAAEDELKGTLSAGRLTDDTLMKISQNLEDSGAVKRAQSYGLDPNVLLRSATGDKDANQALLNNLQRVIDQAVTNGDGPGLKSSMEVLKEAGVSSEELAKALGKEGFNWDIVTKKLNDYNQAQREAFDRNKTDPDAQYEPALASLEQLLRRLPDYAESAATMNQLVNNQALTATQAAESWTRQNAAMNGTVEATDRGREAFQALGAQIVATPSEKQIVVDIPDEKYVGFRNKMMELGNTVEKLPDGTVVVTADTDEAQQRWQAYLKKVANTPAVTKLTIEPPTQAQLDAAFAPFNQRPPMSVRVAQGEVVGHGGRASGGFVDSNGMIHGPGSGTSDSILAQVLGGRGGVVRVSNRESINTERSTRANWPVIDAMNKGANLTPWFRQLPRFDEGGLLDYAESLVGQGYSQATRWDCSGTVARLVNRATGMSGGDLMTTKNAAEWLAARGFVEGMGGPDDFSVGWYDHGGGPNSGHMAATLPGGINAEQGGKNGEFTLGAGAAGADDPQFDRHMYLPVDAMYPEGSGGSGGYGYGGSFGGGGGSGGYGGAGSGGGPTGAEMRTLRNASQKVDDTAKAVELAQKRLDEVNANPKSKESTKAAAQERLNKAQREYQDALDDEASKKQEIGERVAERNARGTDNSTGGTGAQGFAKDMLSGALEALGFDGEVFSDPTQWGIWKLFTGGANYVGGLLKNAFGGPSRLNPYGPAAMPYGGSPAGTQHGRGPGSPGPGNQGDGGLGGFQLGDGGGMSSVGDTLTGALPQVSDFLPAPATNAGQPIDASIHIAGNVDQPTFNNMRSMQLDRQRTASSGLRGMGGF
ncbi:tape measure protein [Mycobacterium phage Bipper]|uniref:Tapemeasure n=1 Tax=Mycobacterium phage Bipper TaxID=1805457 RepID=A0A142F2F1_9CAUD|nr:tail length tape measure protein [Mycobacterium phage Bipper]AMQ66958.1 tape measure protein [Mycobacterium phage Bipper]